MRVCFRACLIAILVAGMLNLPAYAANDSPLGMIIQAEGLAHLGPAKAAIGSTVYPGDSIFTETGSTMRLRVGSSQVYLLSESGASLSQGKDMVHVVVSHGTVGFSSPANDPSRTRHSSWLCPSSTWSRGFRTSRRSTAGSK